MLIAAGI